MQFFINHMFAYKQNILWIDFKLKLWVCLGNSPYISILIRAAHCRWAEVCVFILLYFLVTCTLVNNGCWQVDRACFFYQEKKFTKHTKCIYIDVWIDVWRLAYHIQLLLGWSTVVRLFRWTEKWSLQPPTRKNRKLHFSASISFYFLILIEILVLHLL